MYLNGSSQCYCMFASPEWHNERQRFGEGGGSAVLHTEESKQAQVRTRRSTSKRQLTTLFVQHAGALRKTGESSKHIKHTITFENVAAPRLRLSADCGGAGISSARVVVHPRSHLWSSMVRHSDLVTSGSRLSDVQHEGSAAPNFADELK